MRKISDLTICATWQPIAFAASCAVRVEAGNSTTLSGPIRTAIIHYKIVKIHPFGDGNGRTARLLSTFILHQSGYNLSCCYALEEYFEINKEAYYKALDFRGKDEKIEPYDDEDKNDITSRIAFFVLLCLAVL